MLSALYAIARPSVTRMNQLKKVEVIHIGERNTSKVTIID